METASEVGLLYRADRAEREDQPQFGTPAYMAVRKRDRHRRDRVRELMAREMLQTTEDCCCAAWNLNHGDEAGGADDAWHAHLLSLRGAEGGYRSARWLAAAADDRWLMYQGKPQKDGTQYVSDGIRQRLWDVPPLAEQLRRAGEATRNHPEQPRISEDAPRWLKDAVKRWGVPLSPRSDRS